MLCLTNLVKKLKTQQCGENNFSALECLINLIIQNFLQKVPVLVENRKNCQEFFKLIANLINAFKPEPAEKLFMSEKKNTT